jgi:inosose dehydratase
MLRRAFVRTVLALPAAAAATQNIRWSLGAVTWVVKASPKSPDWADILADVKAGGFDGFEPFTTPTLPVDDANIARLEKLAPARGLRLAGIYWGDEFNKESEFDRIVHNDSHRFLGYIKRLAGDRLIIGPPSPNVPDEKAAIRQMAKTMNALGRIAARSGIKVAVHPHVSGLIENQRQIDQLMDQTDPGLFFFGPDTAQVWMGGSDPVRMVEKYKHRIAYLHYKDIKGYYRDSKNYLDNVIELGRGVIDFPAIHRILKSVNYRGWITIDLDNARISPLESAKINREYIDRVLNPIYK